MKNLIVLLTLVFSCSIWSQMTQTIKVTVPNVTDEVYISGNQEALGNWKVDQVKLNKISDHERSIELDLEYPAEFKFTRGSWDKEGVIKSYTDNPNIILENEDAKSDFTIKTWMDNLDAEKLGLDYDIQYVNSKKMGTKRMLKVFVPENYTPEKTYPVIYLTDAQSDNFDVAKAYVHALSRSQYNVIPESIVVGIYQSNRNNDFYSKGDGEYFTEFLIDELVPFIDAKYNTSGFNAMIGHSNGAEYNHILMLRDDNPFHGFISLSTYLRENDENKEKLADFFKNYDGRNIYYFIANATLDPPSRFEAGGVIDSIYLDTPNQHVKFSNQNFEANHQTIVTNGLLEGLKFIYKDYSSIDAYPTIMDLDENYLANLKNNYGIEGQFTIHHIENYYMDIINKKSKEEWEYFIDFIDRYKLFYGKPLDAVNVANGYFNMEMYPETIEHYNRAIEEFHTVEPQVFYANIFRAVRSYKNEGKIAEGIDFLERSKEVLADEYTLRMNYRIANFSLKNNIDTKKGRRALRYCKDNYEENGLFTKEDLNSLENLL